ncbi:THO complex subunit 2 [Phytophthora rubi]|uniref:THO complex subunit 2 n=1 Tax=Phytophthora rubi TaxID=129364 RepID=A0A6A3NRM3_9STRA|nr:THO complex subunit 2 [Phytophthora rubi]
MTERGRTSVTLISERTLHHWADSGRSDVLTHLTRALGEFSGHEADSDLPRLLYELVWVVLHNKLTKQEALALLKDAQLTKRAEACDLLTDLLWVVAKEVEAGERGHARHTSKEWRGLCALVKAAADEQLLTVAHLKGALEFDLLHDAELAPDPQLMAKKVVRINTKTLYTQTKYNLLREETEGFSKVLSLLHTGVTKSQLQATSTDLVSLIGFFDLDANRVLDLVLDAYEMHPRNDCFAQLLEIFKRDSLPHVMGFKFQFYKRDPPAVEGLTTPRSLYRLAATLLNKGLVELDALLPHLAPSRGDIVKAAAEHEKELIKKAGSLGQISLTAKKDGDKAEGEDEAAAEDKRKKDAEHNQVYGVIVGLLEIGARERAFEMISWFQKRGVNPLMFTPLTAELCAVVNVMIEEVFAPLSSRSMQLINGKNDGAKAVFGAAMKATPHASTSNHYIRRVATLEDCVTEVFPIVEMIGPQLYHDQFLFVKLLRIVGKLVDEHTKKTSASAAKAEKEVALLGKVKSLLVNTFLPAMSLQECNPSTAFLVWDLIKALPCDERYRMYLHWLEAYGKYPELRLKEAEVVQGTRGVMRRLTADRAKLSARSLTHVAHSNPLIVFRTMLRQIQSYDNLIQPVVESFKFVTPLGMDVLSFVLVSELSRPQKSMKSDGTHVSLWLTSLANFSGSFYRKYPNVELAGLLQYLIQRLQNWASVDLIVLSELLTKMGSCLSLEDISVSQLEAQAGGPHLWYEPTDPKFQNRRAIPRLRDALIKRDLALPLCILICQMRSRIEYHEDRELPHLKLLGRVFDTCQLTLSQLLQFFGGVVDPLVYRKMLPSITTLVREYNVPAELAMALCRPAMRSDDPVLQTAPRGVHATGSTNTAGNGESAANGTSTGEKSWYMYNSEFLKDIQDALRTDNGADSKPESPFIGLTPELYATFWGLKLYDIHIPFQQYESEILRLRNSVTSGANASLSASERKKLKEKTTQMIDVLTTEQKDQVAHRKRVYERLEEMKDKFFKLEPKDHQTAIDELLQKCVIPRSLISPEDALFAAKFMERLHTFSTPQLSTLQYIHKVNTKVSALVLCATEREASNFGIFMKETLGLTLRWYQNGATYDDEAIHDKIGMSLDLVDDKKRMAHRQFKSAYANWHKQLELVYTTALSSGEYMPIRNTLVVLTKLIDVFPAGRATAGVILSIVEKLTNEDREDIKIMAKRYFALLTKRKASLIDDRLLRTRNAPAKSPTAASSSNDKKNTTDTAEDESKNRNEDDKIQNSKRDGSSRPVLSRMESQELESGEIVMGKPNDTTSSRTKQLDSDRGRGGRGGSADPPHDRRNRGDRGEPDERRDSSADAPRERRLSEERRGRREHRDREASPSVAKSTGQNNSASSRMNEARETRDRSGSASRKHERSPAPRRSRSGDRVDDRGNNSDSRHPSRERERGRERGQANRGGRGEGDRRGRGDRDTNSLQSSRSRSHDRHERNQRNRVSVLGREGESDNALRKPEASKTNEESVKLTSSPKPDREAEPLKPNRGMKAERESVKTESLTPEVGRKRARPAEQSEAALRRQLTAEKEAKAKEQQSGDRSRPVARDRMRPPLPSTVTASPAGKNSPTGAGTPTGGARKIVSLVSSSRKREREPATESDPPANSAPEGKRRRDGGGGGGGNGNGNGNGNGGEPKRGGHDDKRKRKNRGGGGEGNNGNQQQQRDQMRGRQDRGGRNGNNDRRGGHDERGGNGGNGGRRRDRNDNRGGRR